MTTTEIDQVNIAPEGIAARSFDYEVEKIDKLISQKPEAGVDADDSEEATHHLSDKHDHKLRDQKSSTSSIASTSGNFSSSVSQKR